MPVLSWYGQEAFLEESEVRSVKKFTFDEIRQAGAREGMTHAVDAIIRTVQAGGTSCSEAEWLEAGCTAGRGSAALAVLRRVRKDRAVIPAAAGDDVVYVREIKEQWRKLFPQASAGTVAAEVDQLVHEIFGRRENFPDGCIVTDAKDCWWQRHDVDGKTGWYAFGSSRLYDDDVPVRPLEVQS